jgi:UDP-N-acetylmuramyl pentapeptide phosphotransferase/UDP-N-acetylglucosamine-1-phosphate transferase
MNFNLFFIVFLSSFSTAFILLPQIIKLANKKKLNFIAKDEATGLNGRQISNLGGVAIFISIRVTQLLFFDIPNFPYNYFIASLSILFLIGLNDDLIDSSPLSRFFFQALAALVFIYSDQFFIKSLEGIFFIGTFHPIFSVLLTLLFIMGTINAYNLIDGVDGLAGSLGVVGSLFFTFLFFLIGDIGLTLLSLSLLGGCMAFLCFNISPAKIFLGDSGAYIIGFTFSVLSIKLINVVSVSPLQLFNFKISSAFSIISAIIMIPVYDSLRVFIIRLYQKKSPFKGDHNHLHHILLRLGFSHLQIMLTLSLITLILFFVSLLLQPLGSTISIAILFAIMIGFNLMVNLFQNRFKTDESSVYMEFK